MVLNRGSRRSPIDVAIGQRIRQRRRELGLTQRRLGEALNTSQNQIKNYESGAHRLAAASLHDLSIVLKVSIEWFFGDVSSPEEPRFPLDSETEALALYQLGQLLGKVEDPKQRAILRSLLQRLSLGNETSRQNDDEDH